MVEAAGAGWSGEIALAFAAYPGGTALAGRGHRGPLAVQRPFFPEGPAVCHAYLLHPPGGMVGGDRLSVAVDVGAAARALVTTPAAGKVYRSAGATAHVRQRLRVAAGGSLEWLPQETIFHDGAAVDLRTLIELEPGACFAGMELLCFGLPARGEGWTRGHCRQRIELGRAGETTPILIELGRFDAALPVHGAAWGLRAASVAGTLIAAPAPDGGALDAIRARAAALPAGDLGSATALDDGAALVCRYLGASAERGGAFLREAWRLWRPGALGRLACAPRIWST